ncbi:PREDICTED: leukocyte immunoglobulin-like receptor subfamily A member 6 [Capra hircus]|uniref:leukocyte immunoglobulin-like receptor subfamily A member 6 n=1 Tax=Capra hircus TaxID=9925 RepID=UPI000846A315|nr:PREDICTED: leukocyte immunoglobulin-like receptor subfamily A member 6 [Capra hircus]
MAVADEWVLPKPSIQADPGTMVAQGSPVTTWCQGSLMVDVYRLYKEKGSIYWEAKTPQDSRNKAKFYFASSSSSDARQYQCAYQSRNGWSVQSDPLPLVLTGKREGQVPRTVGSTSQAEEKPSLSTQPGSLVLPGDNLTLRCRSEASFGSFALIKDEGLSPPLRLEGQQSPDLTLGWMSCTHRGRYRCYSGHNSYAWSDPSAPLDILITAEVPLSWPRSRLSSQGAGPGSALVVTGPGRGSWSRGPGMHRKPSLSAHPGASVPQGENVTLQCRSEVQSDTFHLSKEGSLAAPQHLRLQDPAPPVQANFTLRAVTSAHSGTYRCYSSQSTAPHLLSLPSDPLELLFLGSSWGLRTPPTCGSSTSAE